MEFGFREGDRRPRRPSPDRRRFAPPQAGPFHGEPPPSPFEWEAAALRERIIREEVERRIIEEEVRRDLALARARRRFHGGFGPVPFVGPDGPAIVPPPPAGLFFRPDGTSTPPMPMPLMPVGMHPECPPPLLFVSWEGLGPRRLQEFGRPMQLNETRMGALTPPRPKHTLQLREIAPSQSSEVLPSGTKVCGVKRKAESISTTTEPTKLQASVRDWSCALCQVSTTSETGLNQHLEGKKHKAKLLQCGAIKAMDANKSGLQVTTRNDNSAAPSDARKEIHILVDGEMHRVVQKSNCIWCERCRVSCTNAAAMADHLRGKKHSLWNKVWKSIKAVRMNKEVKEDSAATCEGKVNEDGSTGIREEEHKEEDTYMTSEFIGDGAFEIPMEMKETTDMAEEVDANSHYNVIPVEIKTKDSDTASKANGNCAGETKQEGIDMDVAMDVNKNFLLKGHQKSRNKANKNFLWKVHLKSRKKTNKKFLFKVHQKSRKKANKNFWISKCIRNVERRQRSGSEVNENSTIEIPAEERHMKKPQMQPTGSTEPALEEEQHIASVFFFGQQ